MTFLYIAFALTLVYWWTESPSEAMTWFSSWHSSKPINPKTYHLVRLPETIAIIGSHLIIGYMCLGLLGASMVFLVEIIGCVCYERIYCAMNYKDFWYQKTSKWLGISHPSVWVEVVLLTVAFVALIILLGR